MKKRSEIKEIDLFVENIENEIDKLYKELIESIKKPYLKEINEFIKDNININKLDSMKNTSAVYSMINSKMSKLNQKNIKVIENFFVTKRNFSLKIFDKLLIDKNNLKLKIDESYKNRNVWEIIKTPKYIKEIEREFRILDEIRNLTLKNYEDAVVDHIPFKFDSDFLIDSKSEIIQHSRDLELSNMLSNFHDLDHNEKLDSIDKLKETINKTTYEIMDRIEENLLIKAEAFKSQMLGNEITQAKQKFKVNDSITRSVFAESVDKILKIPEKLTTIDGLKRTVAGMGLVAFMGFSISSAGSLLSDTTVEKINNNQLYNDFKPAIKEIAPHIIIIIDNLLKSKNLDFDALNSEVDKIKSEMFHEEKPSIVQINKTEHKVDILKEINETTQKKDFLNIEM